MPSFEEIANMPSGEVKPPPVLPIGTYLVGVIGIPEIITANSGTQGVRFKLKFFQAREDVDKAQLDAALTTAGRKLQDCEMNDTFYVTENSAFILKSHLADVIGIDDQKGRKNLKQMWTEAAGGQYLVHIRHKPRQDGTGLFAEIDSRAKAA